MEQVFFLFLVLFRDCACAAINYGNTKFWWGDDFHSSQSGSVEYMEGLIVSETNVVEGEISGSENLEDY